MTAIVYLSLGSNLGNREANLRAALAGLQPVAPVRKVSSIYETQPVGVTDQPSFLNVAVEAETELSPEVLLRAIKRLEQELGRRATFRWGPRVIDIDILLYGEQIVDEPGLSVPHKEMLNRAFVLVPLAEIAGEIVHPTEARRIATLRDQAPNVETVRLYR